MTMISKQMVTGCGIPDLYCLIKACRGDTLTIGRPCTGQQPTSMTTICRMVARGVWKGGGDITLNWLVVQALQPEQSSTCSEQPSQAKHNHAPRWAKSIHAPCSFVGWTHTTRISSAGCMVASRAKRCQVTFSWVALSHSRERDTLLLAFKTLHRHKR